MLSRRWGGEHDPDGFVEDGLKVLLRQGGTFEVAESETEDVSNRVTKLLVSKGPMPQSSLDDGRRRALLHQPHSISISQRPLPPLRQLLDRLRVFSEIELGTDEDDWDIRCVVVDLGNPLFCEKKKG